MSPSFELTADDGTAEARGHLVTQGGDVPGLAPDVLDRLGFEGKRGTTAVVPADDGHLLAVAGMGPSDEVDVRAVRAAAAGLARAVRRVTSLEVETPDVAGLDREHVVQALVEAVSLAGYSFDRYRTEPDPVRIERVALRGADGAESAVERGSRVAQGVSFARDLVNEPGGTLTPPVLADLARELAEREGLDARVLDEDGIAEARMGGLLGVNRGSEQPPRFIELRHDPEGASGHVALVGKGITFDAGGLSIKTAEGMQGMKGDLGGAAAVLGAMAAVRTIAPDTAVRAYVPSTDNMLGGDATRPGDVLTIRNGKTVEVLNTDAEGRLILADALSVAAEAGPDAIVDLATLTGACMVALGERVAGLMANDEAWRSEVQAAADRVGEPVWPLPLPAEYRAGLDSDVADVKNIAGRYGGALTAGLFLKEFVPEGIPWAHLDIAGPAFASEPADDWGKAGTGFGVRTLLALLDARAPNGAG